MKKLIYFILIFVNIVFARGQSIIDPLPLQINWNDSTIFNKDYNNDHFNLGWNWSSFGRELDEALEINTAHDLILNDTLPNHNKHFLNDIVRMDNWWLYSPIISGVMRDNVFNAQALLLKPDIIVDTSSSFQPNARNINGAVYGWLTHNFEVGDTINDPHRFTLLKSRLGTDSIVLSNIWPNDILHWLDYYSYYVYNDNCTTMYIGQTNAPKEYENKNDTIPESDGIIDNVVYHPFNGKQWYLTISLRALNQAELNNHLNDPILILKMPCILTHYASGLLDSIVSQEIWSTKFDSIPNPSDTANIQIRSTVGNQFRGISRRLIPVPAETTEFVITGQMLKNADTTFGHSITLSAFAKFSGDILPNGDYINNPRLKNDNWENQGGYSDYITNIDVEIKYCGKVDVAIDWIRVETPRFQKIARGEYDSIVQNAIEIEMARVSSDPTHPRISRFYGADEISRSFWPANRYFNMLVDTLAAIETWEIPPHYIHATNFREYWNGSNIFFTSVTGMPFIREGIIQWGVARPDVFNYQFGYQGSYQQTGWGPPIQYGHFYSDTLNSGYESRLDGFFKTLPINDPLVFEYNNPERYLARYWKVEGNGWCNPDWQNPPCPTCDTCKFNFSTGTLFRIEDNIYGAYYKRPFMLFDDKPWHANLWVVSENWYRDSALNHSFTLNGYERPKTGEETRLMMNIPILLSAKGLLYWLKTTSDVFPSDAYNIVSALGLQPYSRNYDSLYSGLQGQNLIYSDRIGGDYIRMHNDPNGLDTCYRWGVYIFSIMGIDSNQIYTGLKSTRAEMYKMHKWIKANETTLMNLRLQSWYAKGFTKWYVQHPDITTGNLIDQYITKSIIKTRPIDRVNQYNQPYYEQHFRLDSGFYDVTLLKDASENAPANVVYLGVQNRRTDPLIFISQDTLDYYNNSEHNNALANRTEGLNFIPSAEFDQLVQGTSIPEFWQSMWWKRLGAREICIPINCDPNYVGGYYIYARELGVKDAEFRNNNFWLDNKYHHWIDTIIKPREWLISRHLPGEGKLIKLDIHNLAESTLTFADLTEFDSTSTVKDTCTGCEWAKRHLRIEETPMDTGGCWHVTITNDSKCDYTILNLLIEQISHDFSRFEFDNDLNFKTITINSKQYFYKEIILDGDSSYSFRFCGDPAISYSYQYRIGTVITDTVMGETGMSITNNIYACNSPLTGIITKGSCCDSITIQRGKWVQKATACRIDTTYKIFSIGAGLTRYDYGDCTVDYKMNLNSNKCNIRSVNFKRVRLIDSNIENTEYNFFDKDTITINQIVPCGNGDSGKYIYHLQFKDTTGSIKCDQIAIEKCICEYNEFERYYIDTSIIKNSQTWELRLAVIDSGSIQPPSADTTSTDLMVYGILARDANNPNIIYYCEQKQAGFEPPFDLSTPIVLDTITVPLDSSIHVEVYFMDADSIVIGYARYDSTIYSNHIYISNLSVIPNPTNLVLGIHYHVLDPVDVNVSVWDSFGNKIHDFGTSYQQIGDYNLSLDIGSYPSGSYYVRTTARGDVQSVPFMIHR